VLVPHAAGIVTGGAGAQQRLAFDQHDVGDAAAGQVIGGARAHTPAADDDDVRGAHRELSGWRDSGSC
jgi:hypothetical protein